MMRQKIRVSLWPWMIALVGCVAIVVCRPFRAGSEPAPPVARLAQASQTRATPGLQQQLMRYTPELRQKVKALSPELKAALQQLQARHTRHSESLTLRQVMQEILADYQSMVSAIAVDNAEQAAESARRLANHRIPVGGLLPYLPLETITTETLSVLPAMNAMVEGNAIQLAEAAEQGDLSTAARLLGDIATGCVACHQIFRGIPGRSPLLLPSPATGRQ